MATSCRTKNVRNTLKKTNVFYSLLNVRSFSLKIRTFTLTFVGKYKLSLILDRLNKVYEIFKLGYLTKFVEFLLLPVFYNIIIELEFHFTYIYTKTVHLAASRRIKNV